MGFTPAQVNGMSLWEFIACLDGYSEAHGGKKGGGSGGGPDLSDADMRAMGIEGF